MFDRVQRVLERASRVADAAVVVGRHVRDALTEMQGALGGALPTGASETQAAPCATTGSFKVWPCAHCGRLTPGSPPDGHSLTWECAECAKK